MEVPLWLNITLQIIAALIIILILYIVTLYALNIDTIVSDPNNTSIKPKETTLIIDGYSGPAFFASDEYNTVNHLVSNYKKISKSVNQSGGVSLTYQFWLKVDEPNDEYFNNLIILLKGDKRAFNLAYYMKDGDSYSLKRKMPADAYIACPAIMFGDSYRQLKVRFNSNNDPYNEIVIDMNKDNDVSSRKNLLSLLPMTWALLTFVFEDNYSSLDNSANGIKFTFYVNDTPYWVESSSSSTLDTKINYYDCKEKDKFSACRPTSTPIFKNDFLKQNDGNLYLFPNLSEPKEFMKIGNMRYFNYAISADEVKTTYMRGPPKHSATKKKDDSSTPSYISALNKIDMYNY